MATVRRHAHTRSAIPCCSRGSIADMREQIHAFDRQLQALEEERTHLMLISQVGSRCSTEKRRGSLSRAGSRDISVEGSDSQNDSLENIPSVQLETFGVSPQHPPSVPSSRCSLPSSPSPASFLREFPPSIPSTARPYSPPSIPLTPEVSVLQASLAQSLQFQERLYREIERLMMMFESEKVRWKEQVKRLKDEQQTELEAVRRAYDEKIAIVRDRNPAYITGEYAKLIESFTTQQDQMKSTLNQQHEIALNAMKDQLRTHYERELQRERLEMDRKREDDVRKMQEEVARRLEGEMGNMKTAARMDAEEEFRKELEIREQDYEHLLQTRLSSLKSDYDRRQKDLHEQISSFKRDKVLLALGQGKRTPLEELEIDKFASTNQVLCVKCSALLQVSKELDGKIARFRMFSYE